MDAWQDCKNILCIRPDNMGDLLMTSPALNALKQHFDCKITVLVSDMAREVVKIIPSIDEVITYNLPWMKHEEQSSSNQVLEIIELIRSKQFDGCLVFNVYSQNPAPAILLAYLADIPLRAAYCRENLYGLLTDWYPDPEPYNIIKHQVQRDLDLVRLSV